MGEHTIEEVTYRVDEQAALVQHYSEKDTEVSTVETSASMNFNNRKAAMQAMNGLVQPEEGTGSANIPVQESDCEDEQLSEHLPTSTVINAISPPPHAPTAVGASACFDKNAPTQAN